MPPNLGNSQFKRLTGVARSTFTVMCDIVREAKASRRKPNKRGKLAKLSIEDQLLMMLMYNREYRTYLHVAADYGLSESQCWRIINDIQEILVRSGKFSLPGKKALVSSEVKWSVVLIDVGESLVERPKKNNASIIRARKSDIHTKSS